MPDDATRTEDEQRSGEGLQQEGDGRPGESRRPDKSPRPANKAEASQRAEVSNYEIVSHWFGRAAERLDLREDVAAVMRSSYREVQVQIPVKLTDG